MSRPPGGRTLRVAIGTLVLLAGSAGCTDDRAASTPTAPVAAAAWSRSFCAAYGDWTTALDQAGTTAAQAFALPDRAANKAALVVLFAAAATATDTFVASLEAAGTPAVDGGPALVEDLQTRFGEHEATLRSIGATAAGLPVAPEDEFLDEVGELRRTYQSDRAAVGTAVGALGDTAAGEALAGSLADDCGAAIP